MKRRIRAFSDILLVAQGVVLETENGTRHREWRGGRTLQRRVGGVGGWQFTWTNQNIEIGRKGSARG